MPLTELLSGPQEDEEQLRKGSVICVCAILVILV